jgi:hypothetical protein
MIGGLANVILCVRIRDAVGNAFLIACSDVRDAMRGALDLHRSIKFGRCGRAAEKTSQEEDASQAIGRESLQ